MYCGRIHDENYIYNKKPIKKKKIDDIVRLRSSTKWHKKRQHIKERDNYLCQIYIKELYGTKRKYNYKCLQVHHAIPIKSSEEIKLNDDNLITLCSMHHAMCDRGEIPYIKVREIIKEQEKSPRPMGEKAGK